MSKHLQHCSGVWNISSPTYIKRNNPSNLALILPAFLFGSHRQVSSKVYQLSPLSTYQIQQAVRPLQPPPLPTATKRFRQTSRTFALSLAPGSFARSAPSVPFSLDFTSSGISLRSAITHHYHSISQSPGSISAARRRETLHNPPGCMHSAQVPLSRFKCLSVHSCVCRAPLPAGSEL